MREVIFRAWYKKGGYMMPVEEIDFNQRLINKSGIWRWFHEVELMQYTGLKDKNGVDIYEGDVVDYLGNIGIVGFALNNQQTMISSYSDSWIADVDYSTTINMRVLGNVYENKDLLEGQK